MANLKFQITQSGSGAPLSFQLLQEEEEALAATGEFRDREACLAAIHDAVEALNEDGQLAIRAMLDGHLLELRGPDGQPLARSRPLSTQAAAALQDALTKSASAQEEYEIDLPPTMTTRRLGVPSFLNASRVVSSADYDFDQPSSSGAAGFETFQSPRDGRYYFHFNDAAGRAMLFSRGFRDMSSRSQRLRAVIASALLGQRYERREENGHHFFILKARNGQEIARSRTFLSLAEMAAAIARLRLEMPQQAERYAQRADTRKSVGHRFNLGLASLTGLAGFEMLKNAADRRHYFLFNGDDGRPLLFSQGYKTVASRDQAVQTLIRLGGNPARYESAQADGHCHFAVRAGNRQEIARSRGFDSAAAAIAAMGLLQARLPASATAFGVAQETLETASPEHLTIRREPEAAPTKTTAMPAAIIAGAAGGLIAASPAVSEAAAPEQVIPHATTLPDAPAVSSASRQGTASFGRRLWPVPIAIAALTCLVWIVHGRQHPTPVKVLVESSLQSATLAPEKPAAQAASAPALPVTLQPVLSPRPKNESSLSTDASLQSASNAAMGRDRVSQSPHPVARVLSAPGKHGYSHHNRRSHHSSELAAIVRAYRGGS